MESAERLASPLSAPSSLHMSTSSGSSSPVPDPTSSQTPMAKCSQTSSQAALGSPLSTCGHLFRAVGDHHLNMPAVSSAFSIVNHPVFGLHTTSSGRSEFGGLGTLGMLPALATQAQLGASPDWWRASDTHSREAAAFFPLLGLPPMFAPPFQSHTPIHFQSQIPSKNGRSTVKGINGAVNSSSIYSASSEGAATNNTMGVLQKTKATNDSGRSHKTLDMGQMQQKAFQKTKEKALTQNFDRKEERPCLSVGNVAQERKSIQASKPCDNGPSLFPQQPSSLPPGIPQSPVLLFQSPMTTEEDLKQHTSVIQATGLASSSKPLTMVSKFHREASPLTSLPPKNSAKPYTLSTSSPKHSSLSSSPKDLSHSSSPNHAFLSTSPKHNSVSSPPKPFSLCSSPKPLSLCSSPKPSSLSSSPTPPKLSPSLKSKSLSPSPQPPCLVDKIKTGNKTFLDEAFAHMNKLGMKQPFLSHEHFKQDLPIPLKKQNKMSASSSLLPHSKLPSESLGSWGAPSSHSNLFLPSSLLGQHQRYANGVVHSMVQDAPLALITKPRSQSRALGGKALLAATSPSIPLPVNLSTGTKEPPDSFGPGPHASTSLDLSQRPRKNKTPKALQTVKGLSKSHLSHSLGNLVKDTESDILSSKDTDDSSGEDDDDLDDDDDDLDDDEDDNEESDDSLSESESNLDSDSDSTEDNVKGSRETETDTDAERTPLKLNKTASSLLKASLSFSAGCNPLNLQALQTPSLPCLSSPTAESSSGALANLSNPSSSHTLPTPPGLGKRRRVTDEQELRLPLGFGWQRETRIRYDSGRLQGEVAYYAPCGKKLRQYPDVVKYLSRNGITDITRDNFSFSTKIRVGDFYEAREGPQGLQWTLLTEEEVVPCIIAMDGRRGRHSNITPQHTGDGSVAKRGKGRRSPVVGEAELSSPGDAKLLRKLEAQEIARHAAQIKMMRKLEKQATAQAVKEERRQHAIIAAEARRKQKEQLKILKQQEKIKRIQQIRMEKELRAQQILEAKKKKKEEAANAKILEAEKRTKEKEMRRQQSVVLKHQELERHRLDMERERRRQHMMLMKAMDARKKAEERERLKQEKLDEKRLNKERKLELRRQEIEMAKELKKPNEDMCLADHKALPQMSRIPGLVLPGRTFSNCLMVMQFLRSFGKVLGFDLSAHMPNLNMLQQGLLNIGDGMSQVQDLLVRMLSAAVCDPGLPPGHRAKTALGDHLTNVGINRDNVSEILQIYMQAHCEHTELAGLVFSLKTKAFQAHTPAQKASVLAFLVNELACSKSVVSEIEKNIDHMTNLRKDKWATEGTLRNLRRIHAKKTGKRDSSGGGEDSQTLGSPSAGRKRKRKGGESEEDEDEDEDSEEQDDDEEEEEGAKKARKAETCEDEDDGDQTSVEELEKQIEKLAKQQSQIRRKLFELSHSLRSMMFGQDRYKRRYWVLPQCGGVFVEGMASGEGSEEERQRPQSSQWLPVKAEQQEGKPLVPSPGPRVYEDTGTPESQQGNDTLNLFLQKPGSFSKLSKLLEVAKMSTDSDNSPRNSHNSSPTKASSTVSYPTAPISQTTLPSTPSAAALCKTESPMAPFPGGPCLSSSNSSPGKTCSPQPQLANDQLFRVLSDKSGHWFSLLPRSPCDPSSVTSASSTSSTTRPRSPSLLSPNPHPGTSCPNYSTTLPSPALQAAEGSGISKLLPAPGASTSLSGSPVARSENPPSAQSPPVEAAKTHNHPKPLPIPKEMQCGWWWVSDSEELQALVNALHSRGIREKALHKQIHKHMDFIAQGCAKNKDASVITAAVREELVEGWCVEEQSMEVDIGLLQQVEELERKVAAATLQVKGWMHPEPRSESEDLVYHEHKPFSPLASEGEEQQEEKGQDAGQQQHGGVARRTNNPLDIAVTRLAELERNIERRYLKSPLSTTIQIRLDNVGTVTVPAPAPSASGDGEGGEDELAPGMRMWRKAIREVRSAAQLALCIHQMQKSIAWERSIMKVYCQICRKGDNEELLLLCDGCDKGCHTYCHTPSITTIPEGDWFCPACIAKASGQSPRSRKQRSLASGGGKKSTEVKRSSKLPTTGELSEDEAASTSSTPKKATKESKKRKGEESPPKIQPGHDSCPRTFVKKAKTAKDNNAKDLALCRVLLTELEGHQDGWPFLAPVDTRSVPGYKKVIRKPMDFSTIREKLDNNLYLNLETFIIDTNLVFDNCEKFNEDNSDIGRAGHSMRRFFEKRWTELLRKTFQPDVDNGSSDQLSAF
ncbi:bromodomain adjacent to zinc finger domain protein 2B-like [Aplochiton taeniatus]